MSMREEQAAMVKQVFCDAYLFYQKHHGRPMEPGHWDEATEEFSEIMRRHSGATLCGRMMLAVFSQLEEESR